VKDLEDAKIKAKETDCDGIMIGRAVFGNPWLFATQGLTFGNLYSRSDLGKAGIKEKLRVLVEHTKLFEKLLPHKNFSVMKKHYKAYVTGWKRAKELRIKLINVKNAKEVEKIVKEYQKMA
jgi:tRNA-dihydrouridine synthase